MTEEPLPLPLPSLLLLGSGSELRHHQILGDLARRASLVLLQADPVTWQRSYVDRSATIEPSDTASVIDTVRALVRELPIEAVVTYDESLLELVGAITQTVGLPGLSAEAAAVVRDKHAQRAHLRDGWPRPTRSELVIDVASGEKAAAELGYPVVIKPRNLSGNLGVRIVESPAELAAQFDAVTSTSTHGLSPLAGALVEELLEGPEFSTDCWVLDGRAEALFTARILIGHVPHIIDTGSIVGPGIAGADEVRAIEEAACAAALACGLDRTIANVDVKWTGGEPRVLEVNGRPGGLLPHLALLTSGLRVGEVLADVALGRTPAWPAPVQQAAGFAFVYPPTTMRFGGLRIPPACAHQDWLVRVQETKPHGENVDAPSVDPWGHVGWALVTGRNAAEVEDRIRLMWDDLDVAPYAGR